VPPLSAESTISVFCSCAVLRSIHFRMNSIEYVRIHCRDPYVNYLHSAAVTFLTPSSSAASIIAIVCCPFGHASGSCQEGVLL